MTGSDNEARNKVERWAVSHRRHRNMLTKDGLVEPPVNSEEEILDVFVKRSSLDVRLVELGNLHKTK